MKEEEFGLRGRIEGGRAFPHPHSGGGVCVWCPAGACPQKQRQERASIGPWGLSMGGGRSSSITCVASVGGMQNAAVTSSTRLCVGAAQGLQLGKERETKRKASVIIHDELGF